MLNQESIIRYKELVKSKGLLPILVSPFFQKKVNGEIAFLWHENGSIIWIYFYFKLNKVPLIKLTKYAFFQFILIIEKYVTKHLKCKFLSSKFWISHCLQKIFPI